MITIFSDEWIEKRKIVEGRLTQILGRAQQKIGARKTSVRSISGRDAQMFFMHHHLQGSGTPAGVAYGFYHNNTLVAAMSFGTARRSNNHRSIQGEWELYRFASVGTIVGGASKLFQAFLTQHDPRRVMTFADQRWGQGAVYERLGFTADGVSDPGYWWVEGYSRRHHRYKFAKHRLVAQGFNPNHTEQHIMFERGFDRIWDCGNAKYVWVKT